MPKTIFSLFLLALLAFNLQAQTTSTLLRELLDLPAPPPAQKSKAQTPEKPPRPEEFFSEKNIPPDDAPLEDLTDYWKAKAKDAFADSLRPKASVNSSLRLLEALENEPQKLVDFLTILPADPQITEKVKFIFETGLQFANVGDGARKSVRDWLKFNSSFFIEELLAETEKIRDREGYVDGTESLEALVKIDWESAREVLQKLEIDKNNPRAEALAKTFFYRHALKVKDEQEIGKYRDELKSIVTDKKASPFARDAASEALFETEWPGQDEWYFSLMEDESLLFPSEGSRLFSPLTTLNSKNPDKWIPILSKLVGHQNRAVHNAAVQSLMKFERRKAALAPLLPWLFDENWADNPWSSSDRTAFMQIVSNVDLPESVPGLIRIVENEDDNAHWAARSLGKFKDARANPALRRALERIKQETYRETIVNALLECGGLSADEQLSALEFYAEFISKPENFELIKNQNSYDDENPLPAAVSIGKFLSNSKNPDEGLITRLIERQKILQKEKPEIAKILSGLMSKWQNRLVDLEMLRRIEEGRADAETIVSALARRKELNERVQNGIYALRGKSGTAGGISACLTNDEHEIRSAFRSEDRETQIASIACARLLRAELPLNEIAPLLGSNNQLLALTAERYLEAEDSFEARQMVWARHKGEALILGATDSFNPARKVISDSQAPINRLFASVNGSSLYSIYHRERFSQMEAQEQKLRKEILENRELLEIYAYQGNFVKVFQDKALFIWQDDDARHRERVLTRREFEDFREYLFKNDIENLSSIRGYCHYDCGIGQFIRLNRDGGRRVTAYNAFGDIAGLWILFGRMRAGDFKIHYAFEKYVTGFEVLLADSAFKPRMIWKNGDDLRVLVTDEKKEESIDDEIQKLDKLDEADESLNDEARLKRARARRLERAFEHYEWRAFKDGRFGELVAEPRELPFLSVKSAFPAVDDLASNENALQTRAGDYEIRAGEFYFGDLWKVNRAGQIKIGTGRYAHPVVTPDGKWAVASKTDSRWDEPHFVVRINLQTGREYRIKLPEAESFYATAYIPEHGKILLYRAASAYSTLNPTPAEYYLLDTATGRTEPVTGEFQPFLLQNFRPLQSNGKPNQYWAAVYSRAQNETSIGVYHAKNFTFQSLMRLPGILFDSGDLWIDEKESKVYLIYTDDYGREPHLLRFDLPK